MDLQSVNPATGNAIATYPEWSPDTTRDTLMSVAAAQEAWAATPFSERAQCLERASEILLTRKDALARLMAEEMGKPLPQGEGEVDKCAWVCRYYAEHGEAFLASQDVEAGARESFVAFRPLGVVLAVMPWNFPLWQVFRFAAPALMAGNGGLLKHANTATGCALAIEEVLRDAGFPPDLFRLLMIDIPQVESVIRHSAVKAVTLTGSTRAGKAVAETAGAVLKKLVLELGGSDPYLILNDADLDLAAQTCVTSRLINGGQSCIAAKRFIVVREHERAFTDKVVALMKKKTWGNPLEGTFDLGPMARRDLRDELHKQVEKSVAAGAELLLGGEIPDDPGFYYPPTVLGGVPQSAPAACEETFGPVAAIIPVADEDEAVRTANDSEYGLGAAVFTRDHRRGRRLAVEALNAGSCFVNDFVKSDPRLPFGGIGESGYGRELSVFGIREFVNVKTIWIS